MDSHTLGPANILLAGRLSMAVREGVGLRYPGRFFVDGAGVAPSTA
jgi:hypothetical protein